MTAEEYNNWIDEILSLFDGELEIPETEMKLHFVVKIQDPMKNREFALLQTDIFKLGILERVGVFSVETIALRLTPFGQEIIRAGGYSAYLAEKEQDKQLAREQVQSTIDTNKLQKRILWLTLVLSAASVLVSLLDYLKDQTCR